MSARGVETHRPLSLRERVGVDVGVPGARVFQLGECSVLVGQESVPTPFGPERRWHLSVAHPRRYPTWDEIGEARDRLAPPGVWFCMPHPPREFWLSLHRFCFHLWETRDEGLIAQWRMDGEAARALGVGAPERER